jgi:Tol biopolymer transport system component
VAALKTAVLATVLVLTLAAPSAEGTAAMPARWIVFAAGPQHGTQGAEIFRIRTDGSGLRQITNGPGNTDEPSFAPDGKRVAFSRYSSGILVVGLDGSGLRRLTVAADDHYPVFSPDGRRIAFVHHKRLYVMDADGAHPRRLLRAPAPAGRPSWTPDGSSIAIPAGYDPQNDLFLYTVDARDGRIERRTTLKPGLEPSQTEAVLSPSGREVVFIGRRPPPPGCQGTCEAFALYRKRVSTRGWQRVTNDAGPASWSSDGQRLVYGYKGTIRLQRARGSATRTIEVGSNVVEGGAPVLQPR